ncbi:TonB-linked SusC/RagA family outer membrane protein [Mucilaginibacter yixingensis]|uniref:TonB-linked SusC/RagA family outer membrane protein n=1 Tax=Mucilaginibacter yixingensis TaxID=1295612 RepID=A0A2T5JBK0_9SPHI|nr:SusC/RagA family TonB-linked outer membrane protein [Mucilaginibacter yixingensis]PTQ98248.1 TonB-linked SusC/RagA family outer membrane protein [Mucilaginibacter yixingensis]
MHKFTLSAISIFSICALYGVSAKAQQTDAISAARKDSLALYKADSTRRAQGNKFTGFLRDAATGKPVSGMNISVEAYSAALSDDKGRFTISVPNYDAVLVVKGQGYQLKEIPLKGRKKLPDVLLFEESFNSVYDEANLVTRPMAMNRTANAVNIVNTQGSWENTSAETPDTYLQGKVAGLSVVRRSGSPNAGANLFLRGFSSLFGTNAPLVIVDGMIYDTNQYGSSLASGHIRNPFGNLDLRDVESFTVLKDASASVYGTKGANGVILITTNSRPELATRIDLGIYGEYNYMGNNKLLPLMKAGDYRLYLADVLKSSGMTPEQVAAQPYFNDNPASPTYAMYHNDRNWQKQAFKNGYNQNYNLRVSGGDNVARYVLSLGYANNKGITQNTGITKFNTRFNADLNISRHLTVNANLSFNYAQQNLFDQTASETSPLYLSLIKSPLVGVNDVNAQGVPSPNLADVDAFGIGNPQAVFNKAKENDQNYRFLGGLNFKYDFNKSWAAQTLIGLTADKVRENYFVPRAGVANDTTASGVVDSRLGSQVQRLFNIYSDTRVTFNHTYNRIHYVGLNLGVRFSSFNTETNYNQSSNSAIDQLITVGNGDPLLNRTGGELGKYRWLNNYFTGDYRLYNKYIFNVTVAADASSRFGDRADGMDIGGKKMALLPAVSAAWIVSSEKFLADVNMLEMLKLRASYGLTGNDDIGNYASKQYYISQNWLGMQGLIRGNVGNPYLQWEVNKKLDLGLDASFFQERIGLTFDYFRNTTSHMITRSTAPTVSGLEYVVSNGGGMKTDGYELAINGRIINNSKFKWDLGFNIYTYRNRITALPSTYLSSYYGATILTQVGAPAGLFYGYRTNGVYRTNAEAAAAGISVRNSQGIPVAQQGGDVKFVDVNGDHIIDNADRQAIGNPNPDFAGAITTGFTYGRVNLNALFTFSKGNKVYNETRRLLESESGPQNQLTSVNNRWRVDGQQTNMPRAAYGDPTMNNSFSDRWIEDGSYLRLRTLSVTYDVPLKYKGFKYLKVYATGNNLLTFSKYLGYDPEFAPTGNLLTNGIDNLLDPQFKTIMLGVRIGI